MRVVRGGQGSNPLLVRLCRMCGLRLRVRDQLTSTRFGAILLRSAGVTERLPELLDAKRLQADLGVTWAVARS